MACNPGDIASDARCFTCLSEKQLTGMLVYLTAQLNLIYNPMADVSPQTLVAESACFTSCLTGKQLLGALVYLNCQIADVITGGDISGGGGGGGGGLQCATGMWPVPTIVELRQIDVLSCPPQWAQTAGNLVQFDGQGRIYFYDPSNTDTDDGISIIKPDNVDAADPGRWREV